MPTARRPIVPLLAATIAAAAFALVAWLAAPAGAQSAAAPKPDCSGLAFTDPPGDQGLPQGVGIVPAGPNLDITGAFFRYDTDQDAKSPVTVNIEVSDLDKSIPLGGTTASWYAEWTYKDVVYYVKASVDTAGTETYTGGTDDPTQGLDEALTTSGKFYPGPNGIVQIFIPQGATKANDGNRLTQTLAHTSVDIPGFLLFADNAPEAGSGKTYTVAQCPGTGPKPVLMPIKLLTSTVKASKAKKGKSLSLRVTSPDSLTDIKATLKKGSSTYGTGKLETLDVAGTLKVKLKRSLKKGTYKLNLTGQTNGGPGKSTFNLRVR
jgi:uncharacterized protein YaiE (UPF0345 family)